jgi:hypothetical protein
MANSIAHDLRNKYTLHSKVQALQSAVEQLEAAQRRIKQELLTELTKYADEHFHGRDGKDGRDGNDCRCRVLRGDKGDKGERGDITVLGDSELQAAVAKLRADKMRVQTAFLRAVEENNSRPHSGLKRVSAAVLDTLKRDSGL